jgi:hypothetical protein
MFRSDRGVAPYSRAPLVRGEALPYLSNVLPSLGELLPPYPPYPSDRGLGRGGVTVAPPPPNWMLLTRR